MFISSNRNVKQYSADSAYSTATVVSDVCFFFLLMDQQVLVPTSVRKEKHGCILINVRSLLL